jgi:glycosyltransferase involved in cell wall biosynthesis
MSRLLIISHTAHYRRNGDIAGWGPTVREIDQLQPLFDEIVHVAPLHHGPAPDSALPYRSPRIRLRPVAVAGGERLRDKLGILRVYPHYARVILEELAAADAVHVRCPANISLLALLLLAFRRRPGLRWIKYAGNWRPYAGEPRSYALQRYWLQQRWSGGLVTINGRWPGQPPHILSFDNPSLTDEEAAQARLAAAAKELNRPVQLLFVGALTGAKGAGRVLEIARHLQKANLAFELHFLGDGPQRPLLEARAKEFNLQTVVFHGWRPRHELAAYYARAHFVLLPSETEGWPKVLSEAMAYGAVPVASAVASIPQVLAETQAGMALPVTDVAGFAQAILDLAGDPPRWYRASQAGVAAAPRFTYSAYRQAVSRLFAGQQQAASPKAEVTILP